MNIFVGNLSRKVSEDDLRGFFAPYGAVTSVTLIADPAPLFIATRRKSQYHDRESKGYAYVEMPDKTEALAAIQGVNGAQLEGLDVRVIEALPMDQKTFKKKRQAPAIS